MNHDATHRAALGLAPHPRNLNRKRHTAGIARLIRWLALGGIISAGLVIADQAGRL